MRHGTISRNLGRKAEPEDCLKRTRENEKEKNEMK